MKESNIINDSHFKTILNRKEKKCSYLLSFLNIVNTKIKYLPWIVISIINTFTNL
jgi:hypothetical protein